MLDWIDTRQPLLINSIGHAIGLLLFAGFLFLVLRDRKRVQSAQGLLPAVAAALALLWNAGSLVVLAAWSGLLPSADLVAALSFAVLSLLPAVLLHVSLEGKARPIWMCGYVLGMTAAGLHLAELIWPDPRFHQAALWVIGSGFVSLAICAMFTTPHQTGRRIVVSMCLILFAISFVHFSPGHVRYAWSSEVALQHAGIPLALYVLLQDYRFLMLDAFLRFVVNAVVASGFLVFALASSSRWNLVHRAGDNPFLQGVLLVGACLVLIALAWLRDMLQLLLTRVVFGRPDLEPVVRSIREAGSKAESETAFVESAAQRIAEFMRAPLTAVEAIRPWDAVPAEPALVPMPASEVLVPVRFAKGDGAMLLLGRREGGRRYLSEDLQELARMAAVIAEQVERLRSSEVQRLVSQAELRALQSQINPHFLFNCLNTLYGTIPREAAEARRMVLNLSEIFRYSLRSERTFISLAEELQIVRAYLQIESLRLGDRLRTEIAVDADAGRAQIPILSIQPLVENAVKHGVAPRAGTGTVRLSARTTDGGILVEVSDDGDGFETSSARPGSGGGGLGLDNVRQRLRLCFGESSRLEIASGSAGSTVSFLIPAQFAFQPARETVSA